MKIGIVTFWWSQDNYGQLLQCYASQKYLQMLGHDAFLIKYRKMEIGKKKKMNFRSFYHKVVSFQHWCYIFRKLSTRIYRYYINRFVFNHNVDRHFDHFRSEFIKSTRTEYHSHSDLVYDSPDVDILAVGSDVVWGSLGKDPVYFLDFGDEKIKRISLAASFGKCDDCLENNDLIILEKALERIDSISVREDSGVGICKKAGREDAICICDPTMLLERDVYKGLAIGMKEANKSKDFIYYLSDHTSCVSDRYIVKYLRMHDISFNYTFAEGSVNSIPKVFPSIPEWIGFVEGADTIITNSFHGVIFSIIFRKQFIAIPLKNDNLNTRIKSILNVCGLESRLCYDKRNFDIIYTTTIDYSLIEYKIEAFVTKSKEFINASINECSKHY